MLEDVVVKRTPQGIETNVPHTWVHHSPDGFEVGYGGSGPADFALNILLFYGLEKDEAWRLHQDFKWKFVATLPREGGIILREAILKFIREGTNSCLSAS